jgi:hypothetical protein
MGEPLLSVTTNFPDVAAPNTTHVVRVSVPLVLVPLHESVKLGADGVPDQDRPTDAWVMASGPKLFVKLTVSWYSEAPEQLGVLT